MLYCSLCSQLVCAPLLYQKTQKFCCDFSSLGLWQNQSGAGAQFLSYSPCLKHFHMNVQRMVLIVFPFYQQIYIRKKVWLPKGK